MEEYAWRCKECGVLKDAEDYYPYNKSKCKQCCSEDGSAYRWWVHCGGSSVDPADWPYKMVNYTDIRNLYDNIPWYAQEMVHKLNEWRRSGHEYKPNLPVVYTKIGADGEYHEYILKPEDM